MTSLGNFLTFGLLLGLIMIFLKDEVAQRNGDILGYFFAGANLLHFHLNKQFQNMVYHMYFKVSIVV